MKHKISIFVVVLIGLLATSCVKEKLENTYNNQESKIDQYIDIPSLIDMFIIEEFSKDVDVGVASFFVQKNFVSLSVYS